MLAQRRLAAFKKTRQANYHPSAWAARSLHSKTRGAEQVANVISTLSQITEYLFDTLPVITPTIILKLSY